MTMIFTRAPLRISLGGGGTESRAITVSTVASSWREQSTNMSTC